MFQEWFRVQSSECRVQSSSFFIKSFALICHPERHKAGEETKGSVRGISFFKPHASSDADKDSFLSEFSLAKV